MAGDSPVNRFAYLLVHVSGLLPGMLHPSCVQRVGFMYGHLEEYTDVPLGIRAVVSVIYEPPQISSPLSVELIDSQEEEESVGLIAKALGLQEVSW